MAKIIGIDLGTTNSCMAVMDNGEYKIIPNAEGNRTTPSIVAFTKTGERLVGQTAKRQAVTNPHNTIFSIKRLMGRKYAEIGRERELIPYEVVEAANGDAHVKVGDNIYSPPEISAMILQKLKADAEAYLGEPVTQAVITAEVGVTVGGFHFKDAVADFQSGDIESTAAEVVYCNDFIALFVQTVSQRGGGRFVDDAQDFQTGDLTGIFGCLTLTVIEVSRNGDDCLGDRFAEIGFGISFELLQDQIGRASCRERV